MVNGTKVLEIPLEPKNNMRVVWVVQGDWKTTAPPNPLSFLIFLNLRFSSILGLSCCLASPRIDCVGILKLRNADIELRNGETDIGRKNTRVRLVFRVHIPQPGGQLLSLQVASDPIECCKEFCSKSGSSICYPSDLAAAIPMHVSVSSAQRSAQELPSVERQDLDQCSVLGGQQMVLTGLNFTSDSKVVFSEKTQGEEDKSPSIHP